MFSLRSFARSCAVLLLGKEVKPRTILRGLASGYRICVSPAKHLGYLVGTYEPQLQRAIKTYVRRDDTVWDIGANIGYVALCCAKQVGPSGRVIAFEPVPENAALLRRNVAENKLANIQVLEVAASESCGEAVIRIPENLATASLVWHRRNASATELVIKTVVVDELVASGDIPRPQFVKIDVEGAEGQVLLGMRRTVAAVKPVLFVECSDAGREATWHLLHEIGYQCRSATTGEAVDDFESYRHSDFIWLPPQQS